MKLIIKILFILLLGIVIALFLVPYFYKDEILDKVKTEINKNVNAEVDFDDIDISLLKSFPKVSIDLKDLTVNGIDKFKNQKLLSADVIRLHFDLVSVLNKNTPLELKSIEIIHPEANLIVDGEGNANYDIMKESDTSSDNDDFQLKVNHYAVTNGNISYRDALSNIRFESKNLNHSGSGDLSATNFILNTDTDIQDVSITYGGIPYLKSVRLNSESSLQVDGEKQEYIFKDASLYVNQLKAYFDGKVQMINSNTLVDVVFHTKESKFQDLLTILPNAYTSSFDSVDANGNFSLEGKMNGIYNAENNTIPITDIKLNIEDGYAKYQGFEFPIDGINASVFINSKSDKLNDLKVNIPKFTFRVDNDPVEGHFYYSQPVNNPQVDGAIKGNLDLGKFAKAYPLPDITTLTGLADIDVKVKGSQSDLEAGNYSNTQINGYANLKNVNLIMDERPPINISQFESDFSPQKIDITDFNATLGNSDIIASGYISDPLKIMIDDQVVSGAFDFKSNLIDIDEWMTESSEDSVSMNQDNYFDKVDFDLTGTAKTIQFSPYTMKSVDIKSRLRDNAFSLASASCLIGESDISINGTVSGLHEYVYEGDTLQGKLSGASNKLNLMDFMSEEEGSAEATGPPLVPDNVNLDIDWSAKLIAYDKVKIENATTTLSVLPSQVMFQDFVGKSLGGQIAVDGLYKTVNPDKPEFSFKYDMSKMNFEKAIASVETLQILAPLAKYIKGIFNSTLLLQGDLTKDLMPDLNTLSGSGFLETLNGKVKGSKVLNKMNKLFNINELKEWTIQNSKNWFELENGRLELKPFDFEYQNIKFQMEGSHYLNTSLDYVLHTTIPKSLLTKSKVGAIADKGLNSILGEVNKLGLNLDSGDHVEVDIYIKGEILDPKLTFKPKGISSSGVVKDAVNQKLDEVKAEVRDTVKKVINQKKEEVKTKAAEQTEKIKDTVVSKVDKEVDKVVTSGKDKIKEILKQKTDTLISPDIQEQIEEKIPDIIGTDTKAQIDSIKNGIKDWNPFKKKKKN